MLTTDPGKPGWYVDRHQCRHRFAMAHQTPVRRSRQYEALTPFIGSGTMPGDRRPRVVYRRWHTRKPTSQG